MQRRKNIMDSDNSDNENKNENAVRAKIARNKRLKKIHQYNDDTIQ